MPSKRSYVLKLTWSFQVQVCLKVCMTFLWTPGAKGLTKTAIWNFKPPLISSIFSNMSTYFSSNFQYMFEIFRHISQFALKTKKKMMQKMMKEMIKKWYWVLTYEYFISFLRHNIWAKGITFKGHGSLHSCNEKTDFKRTEDLSFY